MSFELTDLRLFVHVAETGSITAGAERAFLSLASASARIRGMEETLGVELFTRGRRGVAPTEAGATLLRHARALLHRWELMQGDLAEFSRGLRGHVRLLCNTATLTEFLPELLAAYLNAHPSVSIDVHEKLSPEIVQDVVDGKADVGVVAKATDVGGLDTFPFRRLKLVLIAAPGHALAARKHVSFAEALEHDFVGLAEGSSIQKYLEAHAARLGKRLGYRVRLRGFNALARMVEGGVGVAIIPESAAQRCRLSMDIRAVRLTDAWAVRQLIICVRDFAGQPLHVRELVEKIRETPEHPVF